MLHPTDKTTSNMRGGTKVAHTRAVSAPDFEDTFDTSKFRDMDSKILEAERRRKSMNDTRDTAKRSLQTLANCEETGIETLIELDRQGEQLQRIRDKTGRIDQHLDASDRLLRGMSSIPGAIYNYFTTDNSYRPKSAPIRAPSAHEEEEKKAAEAGWFSFWGGEKKEEPKPTNTPTNYSMFKDEEVRSFFQETDKYVDEMGSRVDLLTEMAKDMGKELDHHKEVLDDLDFKVGKETERLRKNNRRMKEML